jgi:ABC-2 type transport system permease protein
MRLKAIKILPARFNRLFTVSNRNLFVELVKAELKATDYNSALGILWTFIVPVVMTLVLYFVFNKSFAQSIHAYPLYILIGVVCINFFITANSRMIKIFLVNRGIVLNSMIYRETLILSYICIPACKFLIELALCIILGCIYGIISIKYAMLLIILIIAYTAFVLGVSLMLLLTYCFTADIEYLWTIISRILLFATPIFYSLESLPHPVGKLLYWLNPLIPFLVSFRQVIIASEAVNIFNYGYSLILGAIFLLAGYLFFLSTENMAVEKI